MGHGSEYQCQQYHDREQSQNFCMYNLQNSHPWMTASVKINNNITDNYKIYNLTYASLL